MFHATTRRRTVQEKDDDDDDDTEDDEHEQPSTSVATAASIKEEEDDDKTEDEEEDPELSEWFKIKEKTSKRPEVQIPASDSETEADSDNEDITRNEDVEQDDDDWVDVKPTDSSASSLVDAASVRLPPFFVFGELSLIELVTVGGCTHIPGK